MFLKLSEAKVKKGFIGGEGFIGREVKKLMQREEFSNLVSGVPLTTRQSLKLVV